MDKALSIQAAQIEKLLALLDAHRDAFFKLPPDQRPVRLYFVDSDVLKVYIDGTVRHKNSAWSNLLTLGDTALGRRKNSELTKDAENLTEATGQAVSRFLFGRFNQQLFAQQKRYYVTPEHESELKSIIFAVLKSVNQPTPHWLQELQTGYLRLCAEGSTPGDMISAAEHIFALLESNASVGCVPRAHSVRQVFTSLYSTNIIRPPGDGRSFITSAKDEQRDADFLRLKSGLAEVFLDDLREHSPGTEKYFPIKRKVFEIQKPGATLSYHVRSVLNDEELVASVAGEHSNPREFLIEQTLMALKQANDVATLARLTRLAEWLNRKHSLGSGRDWEVCLISGSTMFRRLVDSASKHSNQSLCSRSVRVIHPLSFLRHPELFDPEGAGTQGSIEGRSPDEEYALTQIFGNTSKATNLESGVDTTKFVQSLTHWLRAVVDREAKDNDRSLRRFRRKLELEEGFDAELLRERVRDFIAYQFADTFVKLTELSQLKYDHIMTVSIPTLDLQKSPTALKWFAHIRKANSESTKLNWLQRVLQSKGYQKPSVDSQMFPDIDNVLREDRTGYSAMLCAAVGFLAGGREWLNAAQTMTSTAAMLSAVRNESYPQGNEALYLRAFLSRITFDPRQTHVSVEKQNAIIQDWFEGQSKTLFDVQSALDRWKNCDPVSASENVLSDAAGSSRYTRFDLIKLRYTVEELASSFHKQFWEFLLDRLDRTETCSNGILSTNGWNDLILVAHSSSHCLDEWLEVVGVSSKKRLSATYEHFGWFIGSQLWAVVLQCWLCMHAVTRLDYGKRPEHVDAIDESISELEELIKRYLYDYRNRQDENLGHITKLVGEIFARVHLGAALGDWGVNEKSFYERELAAIDDLRMDFFRVCWNRARPLDARAPN